MDYFTGNSFSANLYIHFYSVVKFNFFRWRRERVHPSISSYWCTNSSNLRAGESVTLSCHVWLCKQWLHTVTVSSGCLAWITSNSQPNSLSGPIYGLSLLVFFHIWPISAGYREALSGKLLWHFAILLTLIWVPLGTSSGAEMVRISYRWSNSLRVKKWLIEREFFQLLITSVGERFLDFKTLAEVLRCSD